VEVVIPQPVSPCLVTLRDLLKDTPLRDTLLGVLLGVPLSTVVLAAHPLTPMSLFPALMVPLLMVLLALLPKALLLLDPLKALLLPRLLVPSNHSNHRERPALLNPPVQLVLLLRLRLPAPVVVASPPRVLPLLPPWNRSRCLVRLST